MTYIICYELGKSSKYTGFFKELKKFGENLKLMEGIYVIESDESAGNIYFKLKPHIKEEDNVLVIEAGHDWFGFLSLEKLYWLQKVMG